MLQKIINSLCIGLMLVAVSGCSSAVFPEIIEDDSLSESVLTESDGLEADTKNVAYEGEEQGDDVFDDVVAAKSEKPLVEVHKDDKAIPAKTTEVKVEELKSNSVVLADKVAEEKKVQQTEQAFEPSVTYRLETIYFDNGSASVSAAYNAKIREAAKLVKNNNAQIKVLGFSSSRTRNMDIASHKLANFKISAERAENVAAALRRAGVPAANITVEALSDTAPAYLEVMPEGERLNRRAEIYVSY